MTTLHKFALLLASDYPGTTIPLQGCINDANRIKSFLINQRGFPAKEVQCLYNQQMTRKNMITALSALALKTRTVGDQGVIPAVFLMYSGHGVRVARSNRPVAASLVNDADGDEALVPYDLATAGVLLDNDLFSLFINLLHPLTQLFILTDCCNSGSNFDLAYRGTVFTNPLNAGVQASVIQLAACDDHQLAVEEKGGGVVTTKFLQVMTAGGVAKVSALRKVMADVSVRGNRQNPQVSVSRGDMLFGLVFGWLVNSVAPVVSQAAQLRLYYAALQRMEAKKKAAAAAAVAQAKALQTYYAAVKRMAAKKKARVKAVKPKPKTRAITSLHPNLLSLLTQI